MSIDTGKVWKAVLQGDPEAWQRLVSLFAGLVNTVAVQAGLQAADAEDCAQYTWLKLYRKRHSIIDPKALPAWLIRTTHRQAVHLSKRIGKGAAVAERFEREKTSTALPNEVVEQLELRAMIDIGMRQLDPRCRKLLHALYLSTEDRSYREIAQLIKVKVNSLGSLRSRCLQKLRKNLENLGYDLD